MSTALYRLARACVRRRGLVVILWVVLVAGLGGAFASFGSTTSPAITIPGTESQRALDALQQEFPAASGARGTIIFKAPEGQTLASPEGKRAIGAAVKEASEVPGVVGAADPFTTGTVSRDGRYALVPVQFQQTADQVSPESLEAYQQVGEVAEQQGIHVEHGGDVDQSDVATGPGEVAGVAVAMLVLVITFGSLVAAGMTMLTALIGVGTGMLGLMLTSHLFDMTSTAPILALMLGLAVGIDYSLFITSRHKQLLGEGLDPEEAVGRAVGTAGCAVVFAGLTVVIALSALSVVGIPFLTVMGLAAAGTVAVAVLVALTLLPALLGYAGTRLTPKNKAGRHEAPDARAGLGFAWARFVTKRRLAVVLLGVIGLGVLALPAADMRLALPDGSSAAQGTEKRAAYDLISEGFGPGYNGQLALVVFGDSPQQAEQVAGDVTRAVSGLDHVVAVAPPQPSRDGDVMLLSIVPQEGPTSPETAQLVHDVRAAVAPIAKADGADVAVTGSTAVGVDVSQKLGDALPVYLGVVIGLSFLLLVLVFRSLLVPLKATLGFLLTVGATFGVTVAVFQWGWLSGLIGVTGVGPLVSFLPILLIGILFGLAMDYEVFLVSRMREDYVHGASAQQATVSGVGHGARVVTAAGIIMISVFSGFVLSEDTIIKSMGFALAFGVLVDAFVVRQTIVPAVMSLLGDSAWWLPRWLDRALPRVDIEGESLRRRLAGGSDAASDGSAAAPGGGTTRRPGTDGEPDQERELIEA
jgi:RND superfamily putative drug exporter